MIVNADEYKISSEELILLGEKCGEIDRIRLRMANIDD